MHDQLIRLRTTARRVGLLLLPLVMASSSWAVPERADAEAAVTIEQVTPGNVFVEGETPSFDVATSAGTVTWSVQDHRGQQVAGSESTVAPADGRLTVPVESVGYYQLEVTAEGGASTTTTFAVMPSVEPSAANPFTFGVQTHFGQASGGWDGSDDLVPLLKHIGVETVRDAQAWQILGGCTPEPSEGDCPPEDVDYDWDAQNNRFREYMSALDRADIEPLNNFGLANRYYDGVTPDTGPRRKAFGDFAAAVVGRYRTVAGADAGQRQINQVGVYNEPNYWQFGDHNGTGDADALPLPHVQLAAEVYDAVDEVAPDVTVAAPELAAGTLVQDTCNPPERPDWEPCNPEFDGWRDWLDEYFRLGGLNSLDVVSLHPYRSRRTEGPEGLENQLAVVRELMGEHSDGDDANKPIWITEQGWRTHEDPAHDCALRPICEDVQAAFVPRTYVLAMAADVGVERFYWFNFMDEADEGEGNVPDTRFGLVEELDDGGYRMKPSYMTYGVMTSELGTRPYQGPDQRPEGVHSYQFGQGQDQVHVMWVPEGETDVDVLTDEPVDVVDDMGGTTTHRPTNGRVSLTLSGHVQYVHGPIGGVEPPA